MTRKIVAYKENFVDFYKKQDNKTQRKIEFVFDLIRYENQVPIKLAEKLKNEYLTEKYGGIKK